MSIFNKIALLIGFAGTLVFSGNAMADEECKDFWESGVAKTYKMSDIKGIHFATAEGSSWGDIVGTKQCLTGTGSVVASPVDTIFIEDAKAKLGPAGFKFCVELLQDAYRSGDVFYINNGEGESQVGCGIAKSDPQSQELYERILFPVH